MRKITVVCLVAREPGWLCLQKLWDLRDEYEIKLILSHRKKPSSEDPFRGPRPDFERFKDFARSSKISFGEVDSYRDAAEMGALDRVGHFDVLFSCNWKYLIPERVLPLARLGTINLHRGKLPEYKGLEPVKRALLNGEKNIFLTAHKIEKDYDSGEILGTGSIQVKKVPAESIDETTERLKQELHPLYPEVMLKALKQLKKKGIGV